MLLTEQSVCYKPIILNTNKTALLMMKQNINTKPNLINLALIDLKGEIISGGVSHNKRYLQPY